MTKNIFDQFDEAPVGQVGNIFDQFDEDEHSRKQFFDTSEQAARAKAADERVALERAQQGPLRTGVRDVVRNLSVGTPVGSWLDEANSGLSQAVHSATDGAYGEPYQDRMDYQAAYDRATDAESTKLGTLPVIGDVTAGGIQKLAGGVMSAPFMPMARPIAASAAYGTAYGAGIGEDFSDRAANAGMGLLIGSGTAFAAPYAGKAIGNTAGAVTNALAPLPQQIQRFGKPAVNRLTAALGESGLLDPNAYRAQARKLGPDGMLADMSQRLTDQAGALASLPGKSKNIISNAIGTRAAGADKRIADTLEQNLGQSKNLVAEEARVLAQTRAAAEPHYDQFYSTPVPMTPQIESVLQRVPEEVMSRAQKMANVKREYQQYLSQTGQINGIVYDLIKRSADDVARENRGTALGRDYSNLAADLRNAVDEALSPGQPNASPWALAREMAGDGLQFRSGLEDGAKAFSRATHPDQQAADLTRMPHVQRVGYNEGAHGAIRDAMGNASTKFGPNGDAAAMKMLSSEYGRRRIENVSNPQVARQIGNRIDAEQRFAKTEQEVLQNSKTATRLAAQKEFPNPVQKGLDQVPTGVTHAVMAVGRKIADAVVAGKINERNAAIATEAAEMLVARGMQRDHVARGLRMYARQQGQTKQVQRVLERAANHLLRGSAAPLLASSPSD